MKHTERDLEKRCCLYARKHGLAAVKQENNGNVGIPDRMFVKRGGTVLFVEFKRPDGGGRLSVEQSFWLDYLSPRVYVIDSFEAFVEVIEQFINE